MVAVKTFCGQDEVPEKENKQFEPIDLFESCIIKDKLKNNIDKNDIKINKTIIFFDK